MRIKIVKPIVLISTLLAALLFTFCKKEKKGIYNEGTGSLLDPLNAARIISGLGNVKYKSNLQMLEFESTEQFKSALLKIEQDANNFEFDKGNTQMLLNALSVCNVNSFNDDDIDEDDQDGTDLPQNVIKLLRRNAPLSDTVILTFLRKNFPKHKVKRVLLKNCDFTPRVLAYYNQMSLPPNIKEIINQKRIDHVPYIPGQDDFQNLFPNYISYHKYINEQERQFLLGGGSPESELNPKNGSNALFGAEAVVFNQYKEVKIGEAILKLLPGKNVLIKNGSQSILDYIRQNGKIPMYAPIATEPENGFPVAQAQPIIDPNIQVEPTDIYNVNCANIINATPAGEGRLAYTTNGGGEGHYYYWDFGDGFVSYKRNPTHQYAGSSENHTVTVTTYDSQGIPCGAGYSFGGSSIGIGNGGNQCGSGFMNISNVTGFNSTLNVYLNFQNYVSNTPISYNINFGDGNTITGIVYSAGWQYFAHSFPLNQYSTYNITAQFYYGSCTVPLSSQIIFTGPPPSSSSCCDKRDKEKESWITNQDNDKRFVHKLKLNNFIMFGGKFTADVNTYTKTLGIWYPEWASGCVDIIGKYFSTAVNPSGNTTPCNSTPVISFNTGAQCGGSPNHGANYTTGTDPYYITNNGSWPNVGSNATAGVRSGGTAYGLVNDLFIGNCD
jgi:hypothetical protein